MAAVTVDATTVDAIDAAAVDEAAVDTAPRWRYQTAPSSNLDNE